MADPNIETRTVAILFTDIEESTEKWSRYGPKMARALEVHDETAEHIFLAHNVLTVRHTGDGSMAVFASVGEAMDAASELSTAIAASSWPIAEPLVLRMGIHVGPAEHRDDNWFGTSVNRAARIADAANSGQVLLSQAAELAARDESGDHRSTNVGEITLKGLDRPEVVFHLYRAGLMPATEPQASAVHTQLTRTASAELVGRDDVIDLVVDLVSGHRVVTLTGVGGVGKTQLAISVAEKTGMASVFVDLAPVNSGEAMNAFADALGIAASQDPSLDAVAAAMEGRSLLVVVDNCEHLLSDSSAVIEHLLAATTATFIATSREALGISGERIFRVPSLSEEACVELFVERAAGVGHMLEPDNRVVAEICAHLDGIPLAIELAAARTQHLSVEQIADRLGERFRLLTGGRRGVERQRTLDAVMNWSYDLLGEDEQRALHVATTFVGPFDLDAFAAVGEYDAYESLDLVSSLIDKSLLAARPDESGVTWYVSLETVRLYGLSKAADLDRVDAFSALHAAHYRDLAGPPEEWRVLSPWQAYLDHKEIPDIDNLRAALDWFRATDELASVGRLAASQRLVIGTRIPEEGHIYLQRQDVADSLEGYERAVYMAASATAANVRGDWQDQAVWASATLAEATEPRVRAIAEGFRAQMAAILFREDISDAVGLAIAALGPDDEDLVWFLRERLIDLPLITSQLEIATPLLENLGGDASPLSTYQLGLVYHMRGRDDDALAEGRRIANQGVLGALFDLTLKALAIAPVDRRRAVMNLIEANAHLRRGYDALVESDLLVLAAALAYHNGEFERASAFLATVGTNARTPGGFALITHYRQKVREQLAHDQVDAIRASTSGSPHDVFVKELARLQTEIDPQDSVQPLSR
ncbi:MAG: adenylate/guanylate cyclase domain-containing protein [Acidimicrobiia bacterium]